MTDIPIPPQAVEAVARVLCEVDGLVPDRLRSDGSPTWMLWYDHADAACLAMLNAWPGITGVLASNISPAVLILPLTEPTHD